MAAELYARASASIKDQAKLKYSAERVKALDPSAAKLINLLDEYARGVEVVVNRNPSKDIVAVALERQEMLGLARALPVSRMPNIEPAKKAVQDAIEAKFVGRWRKSDGWTMTLKSDHTLYVDKPSVKSGDWRVVDDGNFIVKFSFRDDETHYEMIDANSFISKGGVGKVFSRVSSTTDKRP